MSSPRMTVGVVVVVEPASPASGATTVGSAPPHPDRPLVRHVMRSPCPTERGEAPIGGQLLLRRDHDQASPSRDRRTSCSGYRLPCQR